MPANAVRTVVAVDGWGRPRPKLLWRWPTASLDGPTDACPAAMHDVAARTPRGWLRSGAGMGFDRGARSRHERSADMAGRWRCTTLRRFRRRWVIAQVPGGYRWDAWPAIWGTGGKAAALKMPLDAGRGCGFQGSGGPDRPPPKARPLSSPNSAPLETRRRTWAVTFYRTQTQHIAPPWEN